LSHGFRHVELLGRRVRVLGKQVAGSHETPRAHNHALVFVGLGIAPRALERDSSCVDRDEDEGHDNQQGRNDHGLFSQSLTGMSRS
jgi:hypothetical protein